MTSTPQLLQLVLLAVVAWPWGSGSADFRFISYEDLLPSADLFADSGVTTFSQLLFDISRDQVVVGARDALYRLSLQGLMKLEKAPWPAPAEKASLCQDKGQSERYCHNFVKVLLSSGKRLFTCGTNAFSPQCSWREMENINHILEHVKGVAKCPHSPHSNVTALLSRTGQYFVGSPMDFSGADPAISRSLGGSPLRTNQYNSKWLNDPQFVGSFEDNNFVYFLFRESAVEYINCGKIVYSRIARVCKNDSGGQLMLKDNWTTFIKARLNCSVPGEYPFYFDEIQGMAYVESEAMVYATFTTPSNSIAGSAICAFNMSAIANAFSGPFKHQDNPGAAWEQRHTPHRRHFECQASASLLESSRYQLMDSAVQPATLKPLHTATLETLTHIAVDVLPTKLHRAVHVMYVATASGLVKKISVLPRTQETCIVEIWKPFSGDTPIPIKALHFLKETDSVYIGTEDNVLRIPAEHCSRLHSRMACQNAMDPYCGWNELKEQCTPAPNHNPLESFWKQSVTQCPVLTDPVDGGWSSWSSWFPCAHQSDSSGVIIGSGSGEDQCKCKTRQCNNPPPQNGGAPCAGIAVSVTNCTVHGGWTAWSAWSACSQSCGMAVKTQRRTCGNPAPAHGGRVCVGQDRNEIYCTSNPPCPAVTPPPRDGQWGQWSPWDECSAPCGGGFRVRRRRCDNPAPEDGGQECQGCHLDYETCNTHACSEAKRLSSWTPWLAANLSTSSGGNGYTERRFRFSCRAPVADPALIKVAQAKEEERFCHHDGSCLRTGRGEADDVWSDWSNWSTCSVECGGGHQHRTRTCEGRTEDCEGPSRMSRMCNTHKCKGEWSCWSEWSGCSATCGQGARQRTRHCLSVNNHGTVGSGCEGPSVGEEACESIACESLLGWEPWSVWSLCDVNDEQHRRRKCLTTNPGGQLCQGHDQETRMCVQLSSNALDPTWGESRSEEGGSVSVAVALGSCVAGFCIGSVLAGVLLYYYLKRRRPRIPGSPHYITSKQNPYVTVPLKEVGSSHHAKRAPSFSSSASSSNGSTPGSHKASNGGPSIGTPKLFAKPLVEYETATIKRNSHSLANGHIRADLDQDKFF